MRLETGVVQAEGDWPGIFIRGDQSGDFIAMLNALKGLDDRLASRADEMIAFFKSCEADQETKELLAGEAQKVKVT